MPQKIAMIWNNESRESINSSESEQLTKDQKQRTTDPVETGHALCALKKHRTSNMLCLNLGGKKRKYSLS